MPTSYTNFIKNGTIKDAKSFLHLCVRNFGLCSNYDDLYVADNYENDISTAYEYSIEYHNRALSDATTKLENFEKMTLEEKKMEFDFYKKSKKKSLENHIEMGNQSIKLYDGILQDIKNWRPPEKFKNIKNFAIEQIEASIKECDISFYESKLNDLNNEVFDEYVESKIIALTSDIEYHQREIETLKNVMKENLKFYNEFKESLKSFDECE